MQNESQFFIFVEVEILIFCEWGLSGFNIDAKNVVKNIIKASTTQILFSPILNVYI